LTVVFERRYPVILREFSLRPGSGGKGKYPGGDGVIRDIEFRIPCQVSILSERRVYHPYGLHGGEDAEFVPPKFLPNCRCGLNLWIRKIEIDGEQTEQTMYSL
jgi:5-oxoprolinase (ATP-hydrolysing)